MKLADALVLRKKLNTLCLDLQPVTPATQTKQLNLPAGASVEDCLKTGFKFQTALSLIRGPGYFLCALETLDLLIQNTNAGLRTSIREYAIAGPEWKRSEVKTMQVVSMTQLLLRRKTTKAYVDLLTYYHVRVQEPRAVRNSKDPNSARTRQDILGNSSSDIDSWTLTANTYDSKELAQRLDFYQESLRILDSAIQQLNWGTEIDVPAWIKLTYIPTDPEYVSDTVAPPQKESAILAATPPLSPEM